MNSINVKEISLRFNKAILSLFLILGLTFTSFFVETSSAEAVGLGELANQKNQAIKVYEDALAKQKDVQEKIDSLQAQIDVVTTELEEKEEKLAKVVRESYTSNVSKFDVLLESLLSDNSFSDIMRNLDYYNRVTAEQDRIVSEVKEQRDILDKNMAEIEEQKKEIDKAVNDAEEAKLEAEEAYEELKKEIGSQMVGGTYSGDFSSGWLTVSQMKFHGRVEANGFSYTYYSELALPGGGLKIPGRHTESCGCVCDGDGYIVVANDILDRHSLVPTPLICHPIGKIYDCGVGRADGIDLYVH